MWHAYDKGNGIYGFVEGDRSIFGVTHRDMSFSDDMRWFEIPAIATGSKREVYEAVQHQEVYEWCMKKYGFVVLHCYYADLSSRAIKIAPDGSSEVLSTGTY